jgi:glucokinase
LFPKCPDLQGFDSLGREIYIRLRYCQQTHGNKESNSMDVSPGASGADRQTILGLDIGGSKTVVLEGTFAGRILQRREIPTNGSLPFEQTFSRLIDLLRVTEAEANSAARKVIAISASVPGPLCIEPGVFINPPNLLGWHGVRFKDRLAGEFPHLPVFLEHDGNAGALAEFQFGVGCGRTDLQHLVFLTCGTGMGAGLIINGKIVHGASDSAGEVGHLRIAEDGPAVFGKRGSFEGLAAGVGMVHLASLRFPNRWPTATSMRELADAMLAGDPDALAIADEAGHALGRGLALLVDTLNPQVIVLGALAVVLGERLLAPARRVLEQEALPRAVAACQIVPAALGKGIGDVAALMAAISQTDLTTRASQFGSSAQS